jgi:hypothetical protein
MPKLSQQAIEHIKTEVERVPYGKVTIVINENSPDLDIVTENREKFPKEITPGPGKVAVKKVIRQG